MAEAAAELDRYDVRPLSAALGAEVRGVDVANLDDGGLATVHALLMRYGAIALHGQEDLTDDGLREFGMRWGKLDVHGYSSTVPGYDDVVLIYSDAKRRSVAEGWHSDVSWKAIPPKISMLHARQVPSVGGDTFYASQYAAYDDLSEPMKAFLEPLDEPGTLAMWDNRCVLHSPVLDYGGEVREMHRVAVLCDQRPSR